MADDRSAAAALVGRGPELAKLRTALGLQAGSPAPGLLLAGDAGIGKTRLLRALADEAAEAGFRVLTGHCLDIGDGGIPHQPFVNAFSGLSASEHGLLLDRLPGLIALLPSAVDPSSTPPDRGVLFSSAGAALDLLAADRPLLLILEDLHWADASTRHLVRHLLARPVDRPVHVVASYRADDLHRRHPLRTALAEWVRLPGVRRLELAPLDDHDLTELVRIRGAGALTAEHLSAVVSRAAGNAFYAEELLDAGLADEDTPLPETLADLLMLRLERLDDAARRMVSAAAVSDGKEGDHALAAASGLDDERLDDALRSAVDHKVLRRVGANDHTFRHALLGEVLRDDLLPGERRRIHAAFLAALPEDAAPATVARHAAAAGESAVAFTATVRAAENARRVAGHDEAAQHYELALGLLEFAPEGTDPIDLVIAAAKAMVTSGQLDRALRLLRSHLEGLPVDGHEPSDRYDIDRARLLVAVGNTAYFVGLDAEAEECGEKANRLVPDDSTILRGEVVALLARLAAMRRRDTEAIEWGEQALAIGEQVGSPDLVYDARATLARLMARAGRDPELLRRDFVDLAAEARATGDVFGELRALHQMAFWHHSAGELAEAERAFLAGMRRAEETGWTWGPYGFDGRFFAGLIAYQRCRWDEAVALCRPPAGAPAFAAASLGAVELLVSAGRGEIDALERTRHLRPMWRREIAAAVHSSSAMVELYGQQGDLVGSRRVLEDLIAVQVEMWNEADFPAYVRLAALLAGQYASGAVTLDRAAREGLLEHLDQLVAGADRAMALMSPAGPEAEAWRVRVDAEVLRVRRVCGEQVDPSRWVSAWRECAAAFDAFGDPYEAARSVTRLAEALKATGDVSEVVGLLDSARAVATSLTARPLLREIEALESRPSTSGTGLTTRENEVLVLVADGLSNGDIGKRLFISTKTVSVHVSNILAKLGAAGRTEAAAIARRDGLILDS